MLETKHSKNFQTFGHVGVLSKVKLVQVVHTTSNYGFRFDTFCMATAPQQTSSVTFFDPKNCYNICSYFWFSLQWSEVILKRPFIFMHSNLIWCNQRLPHWLPTYYVPNLDSFKSKMVDRILKIVLNQSGIDVSPWFQDFALH